MAGKQKSSGKSNKETFVYECGICNKGFNDYNAIKKHNCVKEKPKKKK